MRLDGVGIQGLFDRGRSSGQDVVKAKEEEKAGRRHTHTPMYSISL
jgi:hypothetical protein